MHTNQLGKSATHSLHFVLDCCFVTLSCISTHVATAKMTQLGVTKRVLLSMLLPIGNIAMTCSRCTTFTISSELLFEI